MTPIFGSVVKIRGRVRGSLCNVPKSDLGKQCVCGGSEHSSKGGEGGGVT